MGAPTKGKIVLVMTVTTAIIRRELGRLSPPWQAEVNARLRDLFEL